MNRSALVLIAALVAALASHPAQAAVSADVAAPGFSLSLSQLIADQDTTRRVLVADNDDDDEDEDGNKKKKREPKIKTRYFSE